jgi:hypothetical protein
MNERPDFQFGDDGHGPAARLGGVLDGRVPCRAALSWATVKLIWFFACRSCDFFVALAEERFSRGALNPSLFDWSCSAKTRKVGRQRESNKGNLEHRLVHARFSAWP